ncbi:MAG: sulfotransferase family protein [Vicinamibacterales bacterium]
MKAISLGVGRTGTYSLKLALNRLGFGPCHHMEEVLLNPATQVPLWTEAVNGRPDWDALYAGYESAVDWPTAGFWQELVAQYPDARFILTERDPDTWVQSFSGTIYPLLSQRDRLRPEALPWIDMSIGVIAKTGFPAGLDAAGLRQAFVAHNDAVKAAIPSSQLLVFRVKDGWGPLCAHLGVPVPDEAFPRTNDRSEFWDKVAPALTAS